MGGLQMKRVLHLFEVVTAIALFLSMSVVVPALAAEVIEMPKKEGIHITKPWTVKFSLELDKSTVNGENIVVKDSEKRKLGVTILSGKTPDSIVICPPTGGYIPGKDYSLELSTAVKSKGGGALKNLTKMNFKTSNQYEDSTSFSGLPTIKGIEAIEKPILQNKKTSFKITPNSTGDVQYRIYLYKYPNEVLDNPNSYSVNPVYTELTKGYTNALSASNPYAFVKSEGFDTGKYKLIIYIKAKGRTGKNKDGNTDFDNYYSTYFRIIDNDITVDKPLNSTIKYINYDKTLEEYALDEYKNGSPTYSENSGWMRASKEIIKYYMNPYNFLDDYYKDSFLNLNYMEISAGDLNNILAGKGVLAGKGDVFLKAAKENNINPIYLVGHALLETGNGTSALATGVEITTVNGVKLDKPQTVYNMFGIRATDANPIKYGSEYAYEQGWLSVDKAIEGGAKFISSSYISNPKYYQNTLYRMRWNFIIRWHQYATDVGWIRKQISRIDFSKIIEQCDTAKPVYEIPKFKE